MVTYFDLLSDLKAGPHLPRRSVFTTLDWYRTKPYRDWFDPFDP